MRKQLLGSTVAMLFVCLALPAVASAHVLKVDGSIGAILHINPDDAPTTGGSTDYILSFEDDAGRFSLSKCNCSVSFVENGKSIATKQLAVSSSEVSENRYTFLQPAVYTMRVTGAPKQPRAFQPFILNYEVRVTNGKISAQPMPLLLWVGMGMCVGLLLLAAYATNYDSNDSSKGVT